MSEQELSPWGEEKLYSKKKLRKHEQKLRERLQEAQEEQAEALERLRRAEERMRKRIAQVQHLEERLNIVNQQLEALQAPHGTVVTMITASAAAFAPMIEAPSSSREAVLPLEGETHSETSLENAVGASPASSIESVAEEDVVESAQIVYGESELQDLERISDARGIEVSSSGESVSEEEMPVEVGELLVVDVSVSEALFDEDQGRALPQVSVDDVVMLVRKARAVAEAAEEAARIAVERVVDLEDYLEQVGSARHLMQELERLQDEADRTTIIALEVKEAAQVAERMVSLMQQEEQQENTVMSHVEDEGREEPILEMDTDDSTQPGEPEGHPSSLEVAQVEEIEEEEEDLETVAAMIIADAAGIAAAQAEAEAEASSARTREMRAFALKADQTLENVRVAINNQKLSGEGAEIALRAAEREATHAHAALADAEAAEERALNTAMNAEAEAEVAEGMAFAASSRDERDEKLRDENASV